MMLMLQLLELVQGFYCYYWAYGSNMIPSYLKQRTLLDENVVLEEQPAVLEGYKLHFVIGPPSGPCAAVVRPAEDSCEVHGILFKLPLARWPSLLASEGVPLGYSVKELPVKTYGPGSRVVLARTLVDSPLSAKRIKEGLPSERYLNLLKKGVREQGIAQIYQEELNRIETF
jgi:hypothetical protein